MADTRHRVSVKEAARLLDTTEHAIRQRLYRGSLESEKNEDGSVVVLLPEHVASNRSDSQREGEGDTHAESAMFALLGELRDKNRILEEQLREANESNRENRRLLAALTQRIPELEPPQDTPSERRSSLETASESLTGSREEWRLGHEGETYGTSAQEAEDSIQRDSLQRRSSWWRRFFGFE
jgi:hypothetical protein